MKDAEAYQRDVARAAEMLLKSQRVLILAHASPDGDTTGASLALCRALRALGRRARVECSEPFARKYGYLFDGLEDDDFEPDLIAAVDIAAEKLLEDKLSVYTGRIDLCIDHHPSNTQYARFTLLDEEAAATCELVYDVLLKLNVEIDSNIANCIYTGLATDTGCFRYSNTTPRTLRIAALMMDRGAKTAEINKKVFETISRERLKAESMVLNSLEFYYEGRVAVAYITRDIYEKCGIGESELEGIPSIPARIEGVIAGVTIKEKADGTIKISLRTNGGLNATRICGLLGGGGHAAAAGCSFNGSLAEAKDAVLRAVGKGLDELE